MARYICCYCGHKTVNPSGGGCYASPHKSHEFIRAEGRKDFTCSYCGHKSVNPSGGGCSRSPHKRHKYI